MELQFKKEQVSWMEPVTQDVRNLELTQELKLSDGMPDIGRILSAWGQFVLRGKEWRGDGFSASGGMMVWVLYAPEDGTQPRCIHGWIPGQIRWDVPSDTPDGKIRVSCRSRFVDARSVSPRKIMVRAGVSALGQGFVPREGCTWTPGDVEEDVQLLRRSYPVTVIAEAGEKTFQLDEELTLPPSVPEPEKLICGLLQPEITEEKVIGSRLVFRGSVNLHVLFLGRDGGIYSWDFPVNLSQFEDLRDSHTNDTRAQVMLMPTDLDVDMDDEGHFRLRCSMVAQYTLEETKMLSVVEDAYSPVREVTPAQQPLEIPVLLEEKVQNLSGEIRIPQEGERVVDVTFLPEYPKVRRMSDAVEVEQPGIFQVLYCNSEGVLQGTSCRWEGKLNLQAHPSSEILAIPGNGIQPKGEMQTDGMVLRNQLPLEVRTTTRQSIPMVSGLTLGERSQRDPGRPSLILCRAGEDSLWQIARKAGSTVDAIRRATGLEGEPDPDQMLLIPVI